MTWDNRAGLWLAGDTERKAAVEATTGRQKLENAEWWRWGLVGMISHVQRLSCSGTSSAGHILSLSGQAISLQKENKSSEITRQPSNQSFNK